MAEKETKNASSVYTVVSLGGSPRVTPSRGVTPERKFFLWANLQRIVEKRGQIGKKVWGDTLEGGGGDNRVKAIKSDSDSDSDEEKKGRQFFMKI